MGYRELSRMEMVEVVRRWQMGESQRAIARASGVARETVKKYLRAAEELGVAANGPPPTEEQAVQLVQVGRVVSAPRTWASPQADRLAPYPRADHHVAAGGALAVDARAGVAGPARRARPIHHLGTLRLAPGPQTGWPTRRYGAHGADPAWRGRRDGFRAPGPAPQSRNGPAPVDLG